MTLGEYYVEHLKNQGFNEFLEAGTERYIECPECKSDQVHYDNCFNHYSCWKCHWMDWEDERNIKYKRYTIIG